MDYSLLVGIHDVERAEQELNESYEEEENGAVDEDEDSGGSVGASGNQGGNQANMPTPPDSPSCPPIDIPFTGEFDPMYEPFAIKCSEGEQQTFYFLIYA